MSPSHALALVVLAFAAVPAMNAQSAAARQNPFFAPSTLPFQAPPFDRIHDADFAPGFDEGMRQQMAEVRAIADDQAAPTFANTLVALERSGQLLARVQHVFDALTSANTDDSLQAIQQAMAPKLAAHHDAIYLDPALFRRVATLYEERAHLSLDAESLGLVEFYYQKFVLAGAQLSSADRDRLSRLNAEEASLTAAFTRELLAGSKAGALLVRDSARLAGLPAGQLAAAAADAAARGQANAWLLPLQNTTQQPALTWLADRDTRHALFGASWLRTEHGDSNDTRAGILRIAAIRAEKARLLGYDSYAAWKLQDQMLKRPGQVMDFLDRLAPPATTKARAEAADIQALIDRQHGGFTLQPWDWEFYAEQVRRARYALDDAAVRPYFELNRVLEDGVFYAATRLYGITFKERHDLPVYQPDVRVFEVFDADGAPLGLFYCDYFKRDNKSGGAWMDNLVTQSRLLGTKPVVYNVANFTKPAPGQPALISFGDVTTMFHEFGHALHGLFAAQEYPSLSGTDVARDFVEFPSQFNEHWALEPSVLAHYARDYRTGEPMPPALVKKIKQAAGFNQGYSLTELLGAAALDMAWHSLRAGAAPTDVDAFEASALHAAHLDLPQVPPRYRSSYFLHIWANGYAAGYYAYLWTEMLDDDAFAWFEEHGGLTRANGQRFRDMILSRGNTEDYAAMYRAFRGRDPNVDAMIRDRDLIAR